MIAMKNPYPRILNRLLLACLAIFGVALITPSEVTIFLLKLFIAGSGIWLVILLKSWSFNAKNR